MARNVVTGVVTVSPWCDRLMKALKEEVEKIEGVDHVVVVTHTPSRNGRLYIGMRTENCLQSVQDRVVRTIRSPRFVGLNAHLGEDDRVVRT